MRICHSALEITVFARIEGQPEISEQERASRRPCGATFWGVRCVGVCHYYEVIIGTVVEPQYDVSRRLTIGAALLVRSPASSVSQKHSPLTICCCYTLQTAQNVTSLADGANSVGVRERTSTAYVNRDQHSGVSWSRLQSRDVQTSATPP
jgi:hypothetical protein